MILPQVSSLYARSSTIFCPLSKLELEVLRSKGMLGHGIRTYSMVYLSKELQVECPTLIENGAACGILLSTVKRPYRRYPSHVYLFGVLLCLIGISMRSAARRIQILFGITHFSHSTISRCCDRLRNETSLLEAWHPETESSAYDPSQILACVNEFQTINATEFPVIGINEFPVIKAIELLAINDGIIELPVVNAASLRMAIQRPDHTPRPGNVAYFVLPTHWKKSQPIFCEALYRLLIPLLTCPEEGNRLLFAFWKQFGHMLI
jgi:hypothetical protein